MNLTTSDHEYKQQYLTPRIHNMYNHGTVFLTHLLQNCSHRVIWILKTWWFTWKGSGFNYLQARSQFDPHLLTILQEEQALLHFNVQPRILEFTICQTATTQQENLWSRNEERKWVQGHLIRSQNIWNFDVMWVTHNGIMKLFSI